MVPPMMVNFKHNTKRFWKCLNGEARCTAFPYQNDVSRLQNVRTFIAKALDR